MGITPRDPILFFSPSTRGDTVEDSIVLRRLIVTRATDTHKLAVVVLGCDKRSFMISLDLTLKQSFKYSDRTLRLSYLIDSFIEISQYNQRA